MRRRPVPSPGAQPIYMGACRRRPGRPTRLSTLGWAAGRFGRWLRRLPADTQVNHTNLRNDIPTPMQRQ